MKPYDWLTNTSSLHSKVSASGWWLTLHLLVATVQMNARRVQDLVSEQHEQHLRETS